jgi:hypothetical protein
LKIKAFKESVHFYKDQDGPRFGTRAGAEDLCAEDLCAEDLAFYFVS